MSKRILIIDGHPDNRPERFIHALAQAYEDGARAAGHEVRTLAVGDLKFPLLRSAAEFTSDAVVPDVIRACQESILWADQLVILFPLWLGTLPALLKGFIEQVLRPGFTFGAARPRHLPARLLAGRSARLIVTMGMPAPVFRWYFHAHGVKSLRRSVLEFCGIKPVRTTIVGMVEAMSPERRGEVLRDVQQLGRSGR